MELEQLAEIWDGHREQLPPGAMGLEGGCLLRQQIGMDMGMAFGNLGGGMRGVSDLCILCIMSCYILTGILTN